MFCQETFDPWRSTIMTHLPHLSKTQATGLALWSLGMVLARSCALSAVGGFLAEGLKQKDNTVRQRLRERCYEASAKLVRSPQGKLETLEMRETHEKGCCYPLGESGYRSSPTRLKPSQQVGSEDCGGGTQVTHCAVAFFRDGRVATGSGPQGGEEL